jgi:integrase
MSKRSGGEGTIDQRGDSSWRLRYRIKGHRFSVTFRGSLTDARKKLRRLLTSGDDGEHVVPDKMKLTVWVDRWLKLLERHPAEGEGARKRGLVTQRSLERYTDIMRNHVLPSLGHRPLQQILPSELDDLYATLEQRLATRTVHQVHYVLGACFKAAVRKKLLATNPADGAEVPQPDESDHGMALDQDQLLTLVKGFRNSPLFEIVAVAAFTGMRRNEILALRWDDLDWAKKELRIERSLENTKKYGLTYKSPKSKRGTRTINIDDGTLGLLRALHARYLCIHAGVPEAAAVDLSLIKLPAGALMFPSLWPARGERISFTQPRDPGNVTHKFMAKAADLGFPGMRFHDLRGSHVTIQLISGTPLHVVAQRCGHDPAVMLRAYAKYTKPADRIAAEVMGKLSKGLL